MADQNGFSTVDTNGPTPAEKPVYDPAFTDRVIAATGPKANPRLAQIMPSLLRHLHDFAREVDLTVGEWMAGVQMVGAGLRVSCLTYIWFTYPSSRRPGLLRGPPTTNMKLRHSPRSTKPVKCPMTPATKHSSFAISSV